MTEAMPKPKSIDAPEWVNYTPDETTYSLVLWDENGEGEQEIAMRRTEFLTLKRWLAALRGYEIWKMSPHSQEWRATHLDEENGDDITQDDLRMLVDVDRVEMVLALNLRRRLERGAKVEEGKVETRFQAGDFDSHRGI